MNVHHTWMVRVLALVMVLDLAVGALFGLSPGGPGVLDGMYFAIVTVTTIGYGDIVPHGWQQHLCFLFIAVCVIPLWSGSFALLTTGLTANHVDKRHHEMKRHIDGGQA